MTNSILDTRLNCIHDAVVMHVSGVLESRTYIPLRDTIIKAALDYPAAVIVDITDLEVSVPSALAVFTSARWHIDRWPHVPMLLVCGHESGRKSLRLNGITRYVPVYDTVDDALNAVPNGSVVVRRRARAALPAHPVSPRLARNLVTDWLTKWDQTAVLPVAKVVVTVFVENALEFTDGPMALRLESTGNTVTVAVEDTSHVPAEFREDSLAGSQLSSLKIVDALSLAWGCNPIPSGKAVWSVIAVADPASS